ncbi:hypothetical protein GCM10029964_123220 [Kibdelosporangium lantanae]
MDGGERVALLVDLPSLSDSVTSSAADRSSTGATATIGTVTPTGSVGGPSTTIG